MKTPREIPSVDKLKRAMQGSFSEHSRTLGARQAIAEARENLAGTSTLEQIQHRAEAVAHEADQPSLRPVFNLTGVVLHTGLGRARLAAQVAANIHAVAANHAPVELDIESGKRGDRQEHVRSLLCELTGAESAFVVNNCAAAVFLSLTALCSGREVILSRGQMVEIGGAFRMPDIVRSSGAQLIEVGCTNRTRISDFTEAISERTAVILQCHPSNFKIVGFTEHPDSDNLASLAHEHGCLFIDDLGSGCLIATEQFDFPHETTIQEALAAGADLVLASGDKLLGGPQAGLILGSASVIEQIKRHPLARAVRIDKLSLAGLEATLQMYRDQSWKELPVWKALQPESYNALKSRAAALSKQIPGSKVIATHCEVGGGSMPGSGAASFAVVVKHGDAETLAKHLRRQGVFGRLDGSSVLLDVLTLADNEVEPCGQAVQRAMQETPN